MSELRDKDFHKMRQEAIDKAVALCTGIKNDAYNQGDVHITDYWRFGGINDLGYEMYKKVLRIMSIVSGGVKEASLPESLEDSLLDIINYASFAYAYLKLKKEASHEAKL